jgi:hypothetical protein
MYISAYTTIPNLVHRVVSIKVSNPYYNRHREQIGIAAYRDRGIERVRG